MVLANWLQISLPVALPNEEIPGGEDDEKEDRCSGIDCISLYPVEAAALKQIEKP